jgi:hypothetical protein
VLDNTRLLAGEEGRELTHEFRVVRGVFEELAKWVLVILLVSEFFADFYDAVHLSKGVCGDCAGRVIERGKRAVGPSGGWVGSETGYLDEGAESEPEVGVIGDP